MEANDRKTQQILTVYNGLNSKMNEFREEIKQLIDEIDYLKQENQMLRSDKKELILDIHNKTEEIDSLNFEITTMREERDIMVKELREVRNENDILSSHLSKKNHLAIALAQNILQSSNMNGIVTSLPEFSEQIVLTDRPNSLQTFGSSHDLMGLRLRPNESKEETYHSTRLASGQTSNETYYDAIDSHRSSLTNGSTGVRPKVHSNQPSMPSVPKTVKEVLNESTRTDSTNCSYDQNNNLKLKPMKMTFGRLMVVSIGFYSSPSDFWLQPKPNDVTDYIHVIQVKQTDMKLKPNSHLTAADIELGVYCAAIYSADGYWYRAQIIDITYDHPIEKDSVKSVRVLFVDWGNSEDRSLSQVMKLSPELSKRRQAINCCVHGFDNLRNKCPKELIKEFERLIKDKNLKASFNRPHIIDETVSSIVYPVDLMFETENDSFANVNEFIQIPDLLDEINQTIEITDQSIPLPNDMNANSNDTVIHRSDTIVCTNKLVMNGNSNKSLSIHSKNDSKQKSLEVKSKSNQNCATNGMLSLEKEIRSPKSLPVLFTECNSQNHKICAPIIPDTTDGLIVEVSHLENPSYFYLQIRDAVVGNAQFEDLDDNLNAFYSKFSKETTLTQSHEITKGSFWANCFSRDNRWYRVRVVLVVKDRALVNYVDWGNEEWVDVTNLMPLSRQFATYPAMAVKCRLSNVYPIDSREWSEESLLYFGDLIVNDSSPPLTAFIAQKPENFDFDSFLDVFLWMIDSEENTEILVNLQLIRNNFAVTDDQQWVEEAERNLREKTPPEVMSQVLPIINGNSTTNSIHSSTFPSVINKLEPITEQKITNEEIQSSINSPNIPNGCLPNDNKSTKILKVVPELPSSESSDDEWDPLAKDAESDLNNYNIRPNDAGVATVGFRAADRKTCKYYGTPQGCRSKEYCSFLHIEPDERFAMNDMEEEFVQIPDYELTVDSVILMRVTTISSPNCFYGVMPYGSINPSQLSEKSVLDDQLRQMCSALKNRYMKEKYKENANIFPGIGTLVVFKEENDYYRGRVLKHNYDENLCTIFAVDLGIETEVLRNKIYRLGNYFRQFPALAIQCSLTDIEPINGHIWSQQSIDAFTEWLSNKIVCARILFGTEGKYFVELFDDDSKFSDKLVELKFALKMHNGINSNVDYSDEIYQSSEEE